MLFFDAAHHHAQVASFDDDADALRFDYFLDGLGDLGGEAFLNLQAAGEQFNEARNFAEADYLPIRDVGDVHFAEEWEHVMLAEAEHFDIFDDDHFVVGYGEERALKQRFGVFVVAAGEELHGFANPLGRLQQAFAVRVFAEADEHFLDEIFEAGAGEGSYGVAGWFHWRCNRLPFCGRCAANVSLRRPRTRRSSSLFLRALPFQDARE